MTDSKIRVVVTRDREAAGGGIHNYYEAVQPYLDAEVRLVDVGRTSVHFGAKESLLMKSTVLRLFYDWAALIWAILVHRPHIVHVNPGLDGAVGRAIKRDAVSIIIARLLRRRVLVFWRGWDYNYCGTPEFPGGSSGWMRRAYGRAAYQLVLAQRFKDDLVRWGFTCPIAVETTVASDICLRGSQYEDSANPATTNLLFLSRVVEVKGVFELVDAYRELCQRSADYSLTIAGDGVDLEPLKEYVKSSALERVSFAGYVGGAAKTKCYEDASIFCFFSTDHEGLPNAVLEAMGMGLPVVSSEVAGLRDILEDGVTGLIVHPEIAGEPRKRFDVMSVADKIELIAQDRDLHRRMSLHNASYAKERFAARQVSARLQSVYDEIV